jgi:hypothetical protein
MSGLFARLVSAMRALFVPHAPGRLPLDVRAQLSEPAPSTTPRGASPEGSELVARVSSPPTNAADQFLLTVDDAGQFLVALADGLTIGHARARAADLPFLADVGERHARLERCESLREGSSWSVVGLGRERVALDGRVLGAEGARLRDGQRLRLADNLELVFRVPDPASATVLLQAEHGVECQGARTIVLFASGAGGRLRIGAAAQRHVRVAALEHEIVLEREGCVLAVRCAAGVVAAAGRREERFELALPPSGRVDLWIGHSTGGRPPFALSIAPVEVARNAR